MPPKDFKPFSIYDDDEEKKPPPIPMDAIPGEKEELGLEIEENATEDDEKTRQELMSQLGLDPSVAGPGDEGAPAAPVSESMENAPFLQGQQTGEMEERVKEVIQKRRASGKIRDRRKVASIFDKPIEPDRPIRAAKAIWHPFSYRAQAFWYLLPAMVFFGLFYLYPTVRGFLISLTHYSPLGKSVNVGWGNYIHAFQDPLFIRTAVNALEFTLLSLIFGFFPPIALAIALNEITKGKGLFKVLYLLPFVIPAIPAANLWKWIFNEGYGALNAILALFSVGPVGWLTNPYLALVSIAVMFAWKNIGWFMLIYYAALQNMPDELYEAAEIDGAGIRKKISHITLPYLRPIMGILLIIQVLTTFQIFTEVYVMTDGGPMHATEVLGTYIYKTAFGTMDLGYASAMAMLMFVALLLFSVVRLIQLREAR